MIEGLSSYANAITWQWQWLSWSVQAAVTKSHAPGDLLMTDISHSFGGWKSEISLPAWSVLVWNHGQGCQWLITSCIFTWRKESELVLWPLLLRALVSFMEKAMAPHSSTLAWKIPWMEEPGRLQSMGLLRVGHTERLHFHFSLSCIGEGNGNPLQCSCLENPRDGGAWRAAVSEVTQSWTRLKWLSSSSSSSLIHDAFTLLT